MVPEVALNVLAIFAAAWFDSRRNRIILDHWRQNLRKKKISFEEAWHTILRCGIFCLALAASPLAPGWAIF
jgi:hypothetical protein